jgi:integrase
MGSVKQRGDVWRARVRVDGREIARHFRLKAQATAWIQEQEVAARRGDWVDPRAGRATVRDYAEEWLTLQGWRSSTRLRTEAAFRDHLYPSQLGRMHLGKVRRSHVQAWVSQLPLAASTAGVLTRVVGGMFRSAVRDRIIPASPMDGVRVPEVVDGLVVPLTVSEVSALLDETPERWRALVALGAGCGLRVSEALGLDVERVDFMRRRVRIDRQLLTPRTHGEAFGFGPPKTRASVREVPLPRPVAEMLALTLERWPEQDVGFGRLIFTGPNGKPRGRNVTDTISRAADRVGLADFHFHQLRHHFASLLIADGRSVKAVQTALGHATAAETLDTYSHLWPAESDLLAGAVERAWAENQRAPRPRREVEGL